MMRYAGLAGAYVPADFTDGPGLVSAVATGEADLGASPIWITAARLENVSFTQPFNYASGGYMLLEDGTTVSL